MNKKQRDRVVEAYRINIIALGGIIISFMLYATRIGRFIQFVMWIGSLITIGVVEAVKSIHNPQKKGNLDDN